MISLVQKIVMALALLAGAVSGVFAQTAPKDPTFHKTYGVADWKKLGREKAVEFKIYRSVVLNNRTYSDDEKAAKIARKYSQIFDELVANRTAAYSTVSEFRSVGNSSTKGYKGGTPHEEKAKCIGGTKAHMYTKPEWARGAYKSGRQRADARIFTGGTIVNATKLLRGDGNEVCAVYLKQSGIGRKFSYSEATFRIRPEMIKTFVDAEVLSMMHAILNLPT